MSPRAIICRRELKTRARTRTRDDAKTYEHKVTLELLGPNQDVGLSEALRDRFSFRWLLRIEGTGASWYVSTLLHADDQPTSRKPEIPGAHIAIDFGQGWYCENFDEVFAEALSLI